MALHKLRPPTLERSLFNTAIHVVFLSRTPSTKPGLGQQASEFLIKPLLSCYLGLRGISPFRTGVTFSKRAALSIPPSHPPPNNPGPLSPHFSPPAVEGSQEVLRTKGNSKPPLKQTLQIRRRLPQQLTMDSSLKSVFKAAVEAKKVPGIGAMLVDSKGNFLVKETFGTNSIDDPDAAPFDADTTVQIFSCTKLVTSIAALQLMEQGKLSLSDPVEKYVPRISKIQVLESFTNDDPPQPVLRAPKSKPTVLNLLTHTAGFSYDFFDEPTLKYRLSTGRPPAAYHTSGEWEDFETPFVADPGTKYTYGINTDWLGFVVEAASQTPLFEYLDKNVLQPVGMTSTSRHLDDDKARLIMHFDMNGKLVADPTTKNSETVEVGGGGAFLYSTMNDYAKLLATLLNKGTSPTTQKSILAPETVEKYLFTNQLPADVDRTLLGTSGNTIPILSTAGAFHPTLPRTSLGWSAGLLLNHEDLPRGRKAGSGAWAGLGNLYYWIDPASNVAGMVCSAILPFFNPTVLKLFDQLERVAYGHEVAKDGDDAEMNHRVDLAPVPAS